MSKSRTPLILGGAAVSGIGYYLYAAGGNPRAAEKKAESDAHSVAADIKSHLPGRSPNAEGELKGAGAAAGAKIDGVAAEADRQAGVVKSNVEAIAKDAKAEAMRVVDKFDHRVEAEAAKAKGGISSWFGGGK
ncbi:calcofluor white hypersensitive [Fusarium beomiforme]|uniref:Calcofluor white hypersensitive n=1 Tax=Fusarium beomiforme TaxID=44412 RepID=A0A9P5DSB2_9HYPO|nr:calcofluor white hypersensitive [Fusarium beomiforme]